VRVDIERDCCCIFRRSEQHCCCPTPLPAPPYFLFVEQELTYLLSHPIQTHQTEHHIIKTDQGRTTKKVHLVSIQESISCIGDNRDKVCGSSGDEGIGCRFVHKSSNEETMDVITIGARILEIKGNVAGEGEMGSMRT
jgi:hypothetical protein